MNLVIVGVALLVAITVVVGLFMLNRTTPGNRKQDTGADASSGEVSAESGDGGSGDSGGDGGGGE